MVDDYRIQKIKDTNHYIIWTCEGDVGEYPMYGEPDCDGISFCPWCGVKLLQVP